MSLSLNLTKAKNIGAFYPCYPFHDCFLRSFNNKSLIANTQQKKILFTVLNVQVENCGKHDVWAKNVWIAALVWRSCMGSNEVKQPSTLH